MEVQYEVTIDDVIAVHRYSFRTSTLIRRQYLLNYIWGPVVGVACFVVPKHLDLWERLVCLVGFSVLYPVLWYYHWNFGVLKTIRKLITEGKNKALLGSHKLVLRPEGLACSSKFSESLTKWEVVERIGEDDLHVYIYFSATSAIVVPKRAFAHTGEAQEFVEKIRDLQGHYSGA